MSDSRHSKRLDKFQERMRRFAEDYPLMRDATRRILDHYNDPEMLDAPNNVVAMKWALEDEIPSGLAQAMNLLFQKNGNALINNSLLDHLSLFKAIGWLSENIELHTATLRGLLEVNELEKLNNGVD